MKKSMNSNQCEPSNGQNEEPLSPTLSSEERKTLHSSYVQAGIKWIGMLHGISSDVVEMKNGLLVVTVTLPESYSQPVEDGVFIRILKHCRAWHRLQMEHRLRRLYLIVYTDKGRAGFMVRADDMDNEEFVQRARETREFGKTRKLLFDRIYEWEEVMGM
ncbi:hypothetical protein [Rhodohalobacter halophilus]|uniref:hypothetical protein n=1 Tax=Rhodohalobacter halophilus TaxID=1812810 RepID=UPI00114D0870|nr:hypothetical protein [Rhodohalobacter halophilus]